MNNPNIVSISPSSSAIGGFGTADDNIRVLLMASVRNEFGDSCVYSRLGVTALGQHFVLVTRKRFLGGYTTHMITANMRNRPFISAPIKISNTQVLNESRELIERLMNELGRPGMFSLNQQPSGCIIPVGRETMQLDLLPAEVHTDQDQFLEPGDEIFCEVNVSSVKFYHSGIYAGNGDVYHFVCDPQESESLAEALQVFSGVSARVIYDSWYEYVYALIDVSEHAPPRIFRVTHPLICRSGKEILRSAQQLQSEMFTYDIRRSNCQHFSSECSTGVAFSYDMTSSLKYIACSVLKPTSTVVCAMTRSNKDRSSFASSSS